MGPHLAHSLPDSSDIDLGAQYLEEESHCALTFPKVPKAKDSRKIKMLQEWPPVKIQKCCFRLLYRYGFTESKNQNANDHGMYFSKEPGV